MAAVGTIAATSGCGARLQRAALPLDPAMAALAEAEGWCLGGGEDFELVLALEPTWATALVGSLPGSGVIGALVAGPAGEVRWGDVGRAAVEASGGADPERPEPRNDKIEVSGYRHFG
jgi:thiamine-monophosphate kinase